MIFSIEQCTTTHLRLSYKVQGGPKKTSDCVSRFNNCSCDLYFCAKLSEVITLTLRNIRANFH